MRLTCVLALLTLTACADRTTPADSGSDSATSGDSDSASNTSNTTTATTASTSGGTTAGTSDGTGTTTGPSCEPWFDEDPTEQAPVEIQLRNSTQDVVYLTAPQLCVTHLYEIHTLDTETPGHWPGGDCEPTCEEIMDGGCACPGACPVPLLIRLEPGAVYREQWNRQILMPDSLPAECLNVDVCGAGACPVARNAAAGSYEASGYFLFEPPVCSENPGSCDCVPNEDGWCATDAFDESSERIVVKSVFDHPNEDTVEVAFVFLP